MTSGPRSGSRLAVNGVGTQISTASQLASAAYRVVASIRGAAAATVALGTSSMYERPARSSPILRGSTSTATTSWPAPANATAIGRPT